MSPSGAACAPRSAKARTGLRALGTDVLTRGSKRRKEAPGFRKVVPALPRLGLVRRQHFSVRLGPTSQRANLNSESQSPCSVSPGEQLVSASCWPQKRREQLAEQTLGEVRQVTQSHVGRRPSLCGPVERSKDQVP